MTGVDFSGVTLPFGAADLLTAGVDLLGVVGPFVLLGMGFTIVGALISLVYSAFRKRGGRAAA